MLAGVQCIEHVNDIPDDVLALVAERGIHLVPTLAIYRALYELPQRPATLQELVETRGWTLELHEEIFKKAMKHEVTKYPQMDFEEMQYFVDLGMSRLETITAAIRNGAMVLGQEQDLGTLEEGKLADLQVIDGDPLVSFDALGNPRLVMIGGEVKHRRD